MHVVVNQMRQMLVECLCIFLLELEHIIIIWVSATFVWLVQMYALYKAEKKFTLKIEWLIEFIDHQKKELTNHNLWQANINQLENTKFFLCHCRLQHLTWLTYLTLYKFLAKVLFSSLNFAWSSFFYSWTLKSSFFVPEFWKNYFLHMNFVLSKKSSETKFICKNEFFS